VMMMNRDVREKKISNEKILQRFLILK
jgi:hypothetical protein